MPLGPTIRSVSVTQAAAMLGVTKGTIYNRIKSGKLRTVKTQKGIQRVTIESLIENGWTPANVHRSGERSRHAQLLPSKTKS